MATIFYYLSLPLPVPQRRNPAPPLPLGPQRPHLSRGVSIRWPLKFSEISSSVRALPLIGLHLSPARRGDAMLLPASRRCRECDLCPARPAPGSERVVAAPMSSQPVRGGCRGRGSGRSAPGNPKPGTEPLEQRVPETAVRYGPARALGPGGGASPSLGRAAGPGGPSLCPQVK